MQKHTLLTGMHKLTHTQMDNFNKHLMLIYVPLLHFSYHHLYRSFTVTETCCKRKACACFPFPLLLRLIQFFPKGYRQISPLQMILPKSRDYACNSEQNSSIGFIILPDNQCLYEISAVVKLSQRLHPIVSISAKFSQIYPQVFLSHTPQQQNELQRIKCTFDKYSYLQRSPVS